MSLLLLFSAPPPPTLPVITVQPAPQSAPVGGTATFTATVTGTGLTYQWQRLALS